MYSGKQQISKHVAGLLRQAPMSGSLRRSTKTESCLSDGERFVRAMALLRSSAFSFRVGIVKATRNSVEKKSIIVVRMAAPILFGSFCFGLV